MATPSPLSPCFNGRASPALSRDPSQRRPPNKLVKRPLSVQSPTSPLASPTFRRPATSYQRFGTSHHRPTHSLNFEPGLDNDSTQPSTTEEMENLGSERNGAALRPYLVSTVDGLPEHLMRKLSTAATPRDSRFRRILPNIGAIPALVRGTSIANKRPTADRAQDQCAIPTTPVTPATPASPPPVHFRDPFQSIDASAERPVTSSPPEKTKQERQPSISLDETELKADVQKPNSTDAERSHESPLKYTKRRATSTPLPQLPNSEDTISSESLLPNERRNVTDPGVSSRSPTEIRTSRRNILPFYVSRGIRGEMGSVRDPVHRPMTSDSAGLWGGSSRHFESSSFRHRPKRHSIAASDPASTVVGSDDTRIFTSGEEDETDFISDTAFDSIRTQLTKNSQSGPRVIPRIQTIFDNNVPSMSSPSDGLAKLEDIIQRGALESQPSDVFTGVNKASVADSPRSSHERTAPYGGESSRVSLLSDITDKKDACSLVAALPNEPYAFRSRDAPQIRNDTNLSSGAYEPHNASRETLDSGRKMNIFDWSEKPSGDREVSGSESRPRTVHAKQGPEARGSRVPGRKAPSTLHLRSQSVPGSRDPSLSSESRQSSGKFGAWGLGGKGVSEDWDNDFEFDEEEVEDDSFGEVAESSKSMTVPKAIMDRQASLQGQFGQVQELTLLVEELKRLRHQASILDLVHGPSSELWKEAEGIINLATVDEEENNPSPPRSPSSLTFSFDETDDDEEPSTTNANDSSKHATRDSWPASISDEEPVSSNSEDNQNRDNSSCEQSGEESSSAKAKSVLEMIYQQRDSTYNDTPNSRPRKLPFDTQSLHDLVVRAGVVTRALKEVIRKAEGVSTTPDKGIHVPSNPAFSRIFDQPSSDDDDAFAGFDHPLR